MWLAQKLSGADVAGAAAGFGSVSIGGSSAAVMLEGEKREIATVCPGGFFWSPVPGQEVLVLRDDSGRHCILGVLGDAEGAVPDELLIKAGNGTVRLRSDGISLEGEVHISGRLYINGTDVEAALAGLGG